MSLYNVKSLLQSVMAITSVVIQVLLSNETSLKQVYAPYQLQVELDRTDVSCFNFSHVSILSLSLSLSLSPVAVSTNTMWSLLQILMRKCVKDTSGGC